jgi:hypothetical protein
MVKFYCRQPLPSSLSLPYPPTQKATVSQTVDECGEDTLRSSEGA